MGKKFKEFKDIYMQEVFFLLNALENLAYKSKN